MELTRQQKDEITQCLTCAGCDEETIHAFLKYKEEDDREACVRILCKHRCELLCKMHEFQKPIDILDYYIDKLKKE